MPPDDKYLPKADANVIMQQYVDENASLRHEMRILAQAFRTKVDELEVVTQQRDSAMMQLAQRDQDAKEQKDAELSTEGE